MGETLTRQGAKLERTFELMRAFVNTGDTSTQRELDSLWSSLSESAKKNIKDNVAIQCLAMCEWRFIGEALDHSNEIIAGATIALITAGIATYYKTSNPISALGLSVVAGMGAGMLIFSHYQNKSKHENEQRIKRFELR